jgi:SpoVK/Ycf46/Vps4 family AAA+-type ATPase
MQTSLEKLKEQLKIALRARHPLLYLVSEDEEHTLSVIKEVSPDAVLLSYDAADGLKIVETPFDVFPEDLISPLKEELEYVGKDFSEVLEFLREKSKNIPLIVVFKHLSAFLENNFETLRAIKNIVSDIKAGNSSLTFIFLEELLKTFPLLERDMFILKLEFPSREEIRQLLDEFLKSNDLTISDSLKNKFVSALEGLTRSEILNLLYLAWANEGELHEKDIDLIFNYKKQVVAKRGILEFYDLRKLPDDIGGLKNLKKWLERKRKIFQNLDEALSSGVAMPKGLLMFGMPGCGKSMAAKYAAKLLKLPLLRLDMGRIMGQYLGQSEENLRKAIALAEAISPSILWIDEVEKALSGVKGESKTNDTLVRVFGTLLTWMQEKDKPVFVIATANDISMLPPEFLRKGRFDEIFFVDFPDKEAMKEIVTIHLKRAKQDVSKIDIDEVISHLKEGYSGADIEAIVNETVERVFVEGRKEVTTEDLIQTIREGLIKPTSELLKEQISQLRKNLEKLNARRAN